MAAVVDRSGGRQYSQCSAPNPGNPLQWFWAMSSVTFHLDCHGIYICIKQVPAMLRSWLLPSWEFMYGGESAMHGMRGSPWLAENCQSRHVGLAMRSWTRGKRRRRRSTTTIDISVRFYWTGTKIFPHDIILRRCVKRGGGQHYWKVRLKEAEG